MECPKCSKSFNHKGKFKKHLMSHEQLKPFKCPECGVMLSAEWILKRHRETKHSGIKPFVCFQCNVSFTSKDHLHRHLNTRKHVPFVCEECNKVFQRITAFQNHRCLKDSATSKYKSIHSNSGVDMLDSSLNDCKQTECSNSLLSNSVNESLIEPLNNDLPYNTLDEHLKTSFEFELTCKHPKENWNLIEGSMEIDAILSSPTFLRDSSTEPEDQEVKQGKDLTEKWKCTYHDCQKTYSTRSNLRTHIRTAHEKIGFTCEYCKVIVMHNHTLQKHVLSCQKKYIKITT